MAAISRDAGDHRRRILDHQEKIASERRAPSSPSSDPQQKIPLIGEVRRPEPAMPKRARPRSQQPVQPRLEESWVPAPLESRDRLQNGSERTGTIAQQIVNTAIMTDRDYEQEEATGEMEALLWFVATKTPDWILDRLGQTADEVLADAIGWASR